MKEGAKTKNIRAMCDILLMSLIGVDAMDAWWNGKNMAFGMKTPHEKFQSDPRSVYEYLLKYANYTI